MDLNFFSYHHLLSRTAEVRWLNVLNEKLFNVLMLCQNVEGS